ncbi:MAG: hypothetical protein V4676_11330, partial [Bacteroidota bacterium]
MTNNETNRDNNHIPESSSSKGMDSKQDVERSNDAKTDQDFPGYPHYPAKEDIMDQRTDSHQVDIDVENIPANRNNTGVGQRFTTENERGRDKDRHNASDDDDLQLKMGTDADVNEDDLNALGATDAEIGTPQNVSNEDMVSDLDIPGSELDDA